MYANVIRGNGHSIYYECRKITFNQLKGDADIVFVDIQSENHCETLEIDKKYDEIYIMNNDGKTIESYRWAK